MMMGAWSETNFGNDDALDWIFELEKSKGLNVLMAPINDVLNDDDYIESPLCSEALAASEVIAANQTQNFSVIPDEAKVWLNKKQGFIFGKLPKIERSHAIKAQAAVNKIVNNSELKELWEETEDYSKWLKIQNHLLAQLKCV